MRYFVQYQNSFGEWINVDSGTTDPRKARRDLMDEVVGDPEYPHRIIEITENVIAHVNGLED